MDTTGYTTYFSSPIGHILVTGTETAISKVLFCEEPGESSAHLPDVVKSCLQQLEEYFNGNRKEFGLPLQPAGTIFQQQVWQQLSTIRYGKTTSYLEVARAVSGEKAIRAVGAANGKNPICLVVPCHRVIGSDGSLTGYAGGLWRKEWLLQHEGAIQPAQQLALFK